VTIVIQKVKVFWPYLFFKKGKKSFLKICDVLNANSYNIPPNIFQLLELRLEFMLGKCRAVPCFKTGQ